jgi:hypothetical protein
MRRTALPPRRHPHDHCCHLAPDGLLALTLVLHGERKALFAIVGGVVGFVGVTALLMLASAQCVAGRISPSLRRAALQPGLHQSACGHRPALPLEAERFRPGSVLGGEEGRMAPIPTPLVGTGRQSKTGLRRLLGAMSFSTLAMTIPQVFTIWAHHEEGGVSVLSWSAYVLWFWFGVAQRDKNIYLPCVAG